MFQYFNILNVNKGTTLSTFLKGSYSSLHSMWNSCRRSIWSFKRASRERGCLIEKLLKVEPWARYNFLYYYRPWSVLLHHRNAGRYERNGTLRERNETLWERNERFWGRNGTLCIFGNGTLCTLWPRISSHGKLALCLSSLRQNENKSLSHFIRFTCSCVIFFDLKDT